MDGPISHYGQRNARRVEVVVAVLVVDFFRLTTHAGLRDLDALHRESFSGLGVEVHQCPICDLTLSVHIASHDVEVEAHLPPTAELLGDLLTPVTDHDHHDVPGISTTTKGQHDAGNSIDVCTVFWERKRTCAGACVTVVHRQVGAVGERLGEGDLPCRGVSRVVHAVVVENVPRHLVDPEASGVKRLCGDLVEQGGQHGCPLVDDLQKRIDVEDQTLLGDAPDVDLLCSDLDVVDAGRRREGTPVGLDGRAVLAHPLDAGAALPVHLGQVAVRDDGALEVVCGQLEGGGGLPLHNDRLLRALLKRVAALDVRDQRVLVLRVFRPEVADLLNHSPLEGFGQVGEHGKGLP